MVENIAFLEKEMGKDIALLKKEVQELTEEITQVTKKHKELLDLLLKRIKK